MSTADRVGLFEQEARASASPAG